MVAKRLPLLAAPLPPQGYPFGDCVPPSQRVSFF